MVYLFSTAFSFRHKSIGSQRAPRLCSQVLGSQKGVQSNPVGSFRTGYSHAAVVMSLSGLMNKLIQCSQKCVVIIRFGEIG